MKRNNCPTCLNKSIRQQVKKNRVTGGLTSVEQDMISDLVLEIVRPKRKPKGIK